MNKGEQNYKRKVLHRKISGEAVCYCGGSMFLWKGNQWFCENEIVLKAEQIKQSQVVKWDGD